MNFAEVPGWMAIPLVLGISVAFFILITIIKTRTKKGVEQ